MLAHSVSLTVVKVEVVAGLAGVLTHSVSLAVVKAEVVAGLTGMLAHSVSHAVVKAEIVTCLAGMLAHSVSLTVVKAEVVASLTGVLAVGVCLDLSLCSRCSDLRRISRSEYYCCSCDCRHCCECSCDYLDALLCVCVFHCDYSFSFLILFFLSRGLSRSCDLSLSYRPLQVLCKDQQNSKMVFHCFSVRASIKCQKILSTIRCIIIMKPLNYDTVICRITALIYNYPDEADRNASSGFIYFPGFLQFNYIFAQLYRKSGDFVHT